MGGGYMSERERERERIMAEARRAVDMNDDDDNDDSDAESETNGYDGNHDRDADLLGEWPLKKKTLLTTSSQRHRALSSVEAPRDTRSHPELHRARAQTGLSHLARTGPAFLGLSPSTHPLSDVRSSGGADEPTTRSSTTTPIPPTHTTSSSSLSSRHDLPSISSIMASYDSHPAKRVKMDDSGSTSDHSRSQAHMRGHMLPPIASASASASGSLDPVGVATARNRRRTPSFSPSPPPNQVANSNPNSSRPIAQQQQRQQSERMEAAPSERSDSNGTLPVADQASIISTSDDGSSTAVDSIGSGSGSRSTLGPTKRNDSRSSMALHNSKSAMDVDVGYESGLKSDVLQSSLRPTLSSSVLGKRPRPSSSSMADDILGDIIDEEMSAAVSASVPHQSQRPVPVRRITRNATDDILDLIEGGGDDGDEGMPRSRGRTRYRSVSRGSGSRSSSSRSRSRSSSSSHIEVKMKRNPAAVPFGERHSISLGVE